MWANAFIYFFLSLILETQKEPDDLQMWALAYCPKGQWAHDTPKHVYVSILFLCVLSSRINYISVHLTKNINLCL